MFWLICYLHNSKYATDFFADVLWKKIDLRRRPSPAGNGRPRIQGVIPIFFHFIWSKGLSESGAQWLSIVTADDNSSYGKWKRTWFPLDTDMFYQLRVNWKGREIFALELGQLRCREETLTCVFQGRDWVYDRSSSIFYSRFRSWVRLSAVYSCHWKLYSPIFFFPLVYGVLLPV